MTYGLRKKPGERAKDDLELGRRREQCKRWLLLGFRPPIVTIETGLYRTQVTDIYYHLYGKPATPGPHFSLHGLSSTHMRRLELNLYIISLIRHLKLFRPQQVTLDDLTHAYIDYTHLRRTTYTTLSELNHDVLTLDDAYRIYQGLRDLELMRTNCIKCARPYFICIDSRVAKPQNDRCVWCGHRQYKRCGQSDQNDSSSKETPLKSATLA